MRVCHPLVVIVTILPMITLGIGCRREVERAEVDYQQLGKLPRLGATHSKPLRDELARLRAERATPAQLDAQQARLTRAGGSETPWQSDADSLDQIIEPTRLKSALDQLDRLDPRGSLAGGPIEITSLMAMYDRFIPQRNAYRAALRKNGLRITVPLSQGLLADLTFVDHARLFHRLEALTSKEALLAGEPSRAVLPLRNMLQIECQLAESYHLVPRLTAALLRAEALHVLQAVVSHPACSREMVNQLRLLLVPVLEQWPPDRRAWIGDRAVGLHTYEMIRDGHLMSILTREEIVRLETRKKLAGFRTYIQHHIDDDEAFYLEVMRKLIAACDEPFYRRNACFDEIDDRLQAVEDTAEYPLFAATVLLADLAAGQRRQAEDRARCEAWLLALTLALDLPAPKETVNPIDGKPYQVTTERDQVRIVVPEGSEQPTITVPRR